MLDTRRTEDQTPLADIRRAQVNDIEALAQARHRLAAIEAGVRIENLTMDGARANVAGLHASIQNRSRLIESRERDALSLELFDGAGKVHAHRVLWDNGLPTKAVR